MSWVSLSMKLPYNALWFVLARHMHFQLSLSVRVYFWLIFSVSLLLLHHRMSWVSLSMRSPYNALRFVLARHICTSHYLCLFEFIFR